jgi:hypothetical protein
VASTSNFSFGRCQAGIVPTMIFKKSDNIDLLLFKYADNQHCYRVCACANFGYCYFDSLVTAKSSAE